MMKCVAALGSKLPITRKVWAETTWACTGATEEGVQHILRMPAHIPLLLSLWCILAFQLPVPAFLCLIAFSVPQGLFCCLLSILAVPRNSCPQEQSFLCHLARERPKPGLSRKLVRFFAYYPLGLGTIGHRCSMIKLYFLVGRGERHRCSVGVVDL